MLRHIFDTRKIGRAPRTTPSAAPCRPLHFPIRPATGTTSPVLSTTLVIYLPWYVWAYITMSALTFIVYAVDKSRATRGAWRVREATLHFLELAWGWPGALIAQSVMRHKRRKASFMIAFWLIVVAHAVFWLWRWRWIRLW